MVRWLVLGLAAGCAGGTDDVSLDGSHTHEDEDSCLGSDTFVAGISKQSASGRTVAIATAEPTPPDVGDNRWTLSVEGDDGPIEGLLLSVSPWMPLHGHGLTPPTYGSTDLGGGSYEIGTFDLIMPGLWEFTVDTAAGGSEPDEAVFLFCAEG